MEQAMASGSATESRGLSQVERVGYVFVAPNRTFTDILRSTSWWLPFLLAVVFSTASGYAMDKQIGYDHIAEQSMQQNASAQEQLSQLTPEARTQRLHTIGLTMKYSVYSSGLIILIFTAIIALLNWASFNFGMGAATTFGQNFAVAMYASLPRIFLAVLNILFVYTGVNTENFDLNNPVGTNIGYYLSDSPAWLRSALSFFDVFGLWTLVLMIVGTSIIARKTRTQAAVVVVGWWLLGLVVSTGLAAIRG
jgi:hypothetical protein